MNNAKQLCWICGAPAASGEHIPKASTLRDVFGDVSQTRPLFYSNSKQRNHYLQSVNSTRVKLRVLCGKCNSGLTQPYDLAWDQLWHYLSSNASSLTRKASIHRSRVFSSNVNANMVDLHLYAVKLMGCVAAEFDLKIDMSGIANAVKLRKPYPWVFLGLGKQTWLRDIKFAGPSDVECVHDVITGQCVFAVFFLTINDWVFQFIYAAPGQIRDGMKDCWNPASTRFNRKLRLKDY